MIGYKYDDGGRSLAGLKGDTRDCVARALAIFTGDPYLYIYRELASANARAGHKRSARNGVPKAVYARVFERHGLRKVPLGRGERPTFSEAYRRYGDCIVSTTKHLAAIKGGELRDTFDGRTYEWVDFHADEVEVRQRKAMSVWVRA